VVLKNFLIRTSVVDFIGSFPVHVRLCLIGKIVYFFPVTGENGIFGADKLAFPLNHLLDFFMFNTVPIGSHEAIKVVMRVARKSFIISGPINSLCYPFQSFFESVFVGAGHAENAVEFGL